VAAYSSVSNDYQTLKSSTRRKVMPAIGMKSYRSFNRKGKTKTKKKKPSIKGTRTHEELMASIARAGRTVKGGSLEHQTKSQRSKAPYKASGPKKAPAP
jgi:hypothetical protein